jgi:hypothetical protein
MLHVKDVKDIKFVIYGVSFEQSDMNTLVTQYETFEKERNLYLVLTYGCISIYSFDMVNILI